MGSRLASTARGRFVPVAVIGAVLLTSAVVAGCGSDVPSTGTSASPAAAAAKVALGSGPADALQAQYEDVIKAVLPSVVQISTPDATGSGVVFDRKGDIVTNAHVVGSASTVQVVSDAGGATLTGKVLGVFAPDDLAVIRVTSGARTLHPATFGQSQNVPAGQMVLARTTNATPVRGAIRMSAVSLSGALAVTETHVSGLVDGGPLARIRRIVAGIARKLPFQNR